MKNETTSQNQKQYRMCKQMRRGNMCSVYICNVYTQRRDEDELKYELEQCEVINVRQWPCAQESFPYELNI